MDEFKFLKENGKAIGANGYSVDHDRASNITYTGLWWGHTVVALLVVNEGAEQGDVLRANGGFITKACNSYPSLLASVSAKDEEIATLHRQLAAEKLRADLMTQRYESANADRNGLRHFMSENPHRSAPRDENAEYGSGQSA